MTDFQNWWDGYFHEINGQKETARAAWQASREWQSLSDEEINISATAIGLVMEEAVNYLNVKIDYPIMFARLIEMHLKEKNNG